MATEASTAEFILDQIGGAGDVSARKMFGEYGVYCDGKFVALICDDIFYVKPTPEGRDFIEDVIEGVPYPGAKPHFEISDGRIDDADWLAELVRITTAALPMPKPKKLAKKKAAPAKKGTS